MFILLMMSPQETVCETSPHSSPLPHVQMCMTNINRNIWKRCGATAAVCDGVKGHEVISEGSHH